MNGAPGPATPAASDCPTQVVPARARPTPHQLARRIVLQGVGRIVARRPRIETPRSILLIRPDHLGDMLFLTPGLHALRRALPAVRITVLAGPWGADVVRGTPDLDAVEICPFPGFERRPKGSPLAPYRLLARTARRLRTAAHDTAVVLRFDHWWGAWLAAAAGIPRRIGYDLPETRPFLTHPVPYQAGRHEVLQNAALLAVLNAEAAREPGPTRFAISDADDAWAIEWLAARRADPARPLVAIHPGAGAPVKQWPVTGWAAVADALVRSVDAQIVLTGSGGERALVGAVAARLAHPALDAAGETTLGRLAALYRRCTLVIGSDSGPLHLAVAVDTPTVHLYGPVPAARFGPWGDPERHLVLRTNWACAPCDRLDWPAEVLPQHACMGAITADEVVRAALSLISPE